jgi:putative hydrolase of the HAD superfamily
VSVKSKSSAWIYTDADNTLWDTNAIFETAQLKMLSSAESIAGRAAPEAKRVEFLRRYDQAIAKRHHSKLRYPPPLLMRALMFGLEGMSPDDAAVKVVAHGAVPDAEQAHAIAIYQAELARTPPLLPGVLSGLELAAANKVPVYVVTEGSVESARGRAEVLAIKPYIAGILSATKSADLYVRLKERAAPRRAIMIGDQPDRDIRLAHNAGVTTVFVRGRFRPDWHSEEDAAVADAIVETFEAAVTWILDEAKTMEFID